MAGLGLALEGGGARGGAHVGVLRALEEEGIPISSIAGTSAGSICAAAYALHGSAEDAKAALDQAMKIGVRLLDINFFGILGSIVHLLTRHGKQAMGLFKGNRLLRWADAFTHGGTMTKTTIPLVIPAVDLVSGAIYAFSSKTPRTLGDYRWDTVAQIAQAVRGSCSIPGVFCPLVYGKALLVDGGTLENLPVRVLRRQGADRVVGVNLYVEGEDAEDRPDDILGVGLRVMKIVAPYLEKRDERAADFILHVTLPKNSGLFSMHKLAEYEAIGYDAAKAAMPKIREVLARMPNPRFTR